MKTSTRKVWVNPVVRVSPQGRDRRYYQTYNKDGMIVSTTNLKTSKEHNTASYYSFPYNSNTGKIYTGLEKLVVNPYKGMSVDDFTNLYKVHIDYLELLEKFLSKEKVSKQQLYEIMHGKKPNDYHSEVGYTMFNLPVEMKDFDKGKGELAKLRMILYPRPNVFKSGTIGSDLKIAMIDALVESGVIAASQDVANAAYHEFYISEDNEAETRHAKKRDIIEAAVYKLFKLKNESPAFKSYQFAVLLSDRSGNTLVKGEATNERVKGILSEYLSDKRKDQIENIEKFTKLYDLSITPEGADKLQVMYTLQQAINTNVVTYRNNIYRWPSKSGTPDMYELGTSFEKITGFFLREMNTPKPKGDKTTTNFYEDLLNEVKSKNIKFE